MSGAFLKPAGESVRAALLLSISVLSAFGQPAGRQEQIQIHSRQAREDLKTKRPDLAIKEYQAILALDPANLDASANAGVLEFFGGQYAKAAQQLRAALQLQPDLPKLRALLGMSEKRIGEMSKAQADLENSFAKLREEKLRVQAGMELIEIDYALSDLGKAAEVVNVLRQLEPADVDILYTAHRIYSDLADETTLSLAMLAPDSARMNQLMAHELARQGKNEGAIARYREALKKSPQLSDVHYELAEMLNTSSSAADRQEAEKEYRAALAENPFDEKSQCKLAAIAVKRSDLKTASADYTRALDMQPNDSDANLGMAKILMSEHKGAQAEPYLERAAKLEPFDAVTHYRLGMLYRELGRGDDAQRELAEFEKLKTMKNRLAKIYQEISLQPAKQDEPDEAVPQ